MREWANRVPCGNITCGHLHSRDSLYCSWRCEHIVEARMARNLAARPRLLAAKAAELRPSAATFSADALTSACTAATRVRETGPVLPSSAGPGPVLFARSGLTSPEGGR